MYQNYIFDLYGTLVDIHTNEKKAYLWKKMSLFPGVPEMLQRLKDAGKKVFLLSNAQALFTAPEIPLLGLTKYFDGILLSSDAGVKKPDPAFFEMLLKQYHLNPSECLMTGNDDIADCHGAASAGIASRYVATRQSPKINGSLPENCDWKEKLGIRMQSAERISL